ncbi:MAG: Fic family protein [Bacteroidales bacterium]|jgi:Fic family protein|nr:Fic family protein [Bacteroidales bacterium]
MYKYIHQLKNWPQFTWNNDDLLYLLGKVRNLQGKLVGRMEALGFDLRKEAVLETITLDVIKSTEIEGEILNPEQVRSSLARRLGMNISGLVPSDRNVDGIVDMMMDAAQQFNNPLTSDRLFDWYSGLFPTGRSGNYRITAGAWRKDSTGPMQIVSGAIGKEKVHFQAPDARRLERKMSAFIDWFNQIENVDLVIKAGVAHLWFVTIHPFDDGNGKLARALADMLLARADGSSQRFYSMSAQIRLERKGYYDILKKTQKGNLDITDWLKWFLNCLLNALNSTETILAKVLFKAQFWIKHTSTALNDRQKLILNKLLDGFTGKLTTSKWAKITKCSADTVLRDIQDLITKGMLRKEPSGGRSTNYGLLEGEGRWKIGDRR